MEEAAQAKIDASASDLNAISQEIWSHPELNFEEHRAHRVLTDYLEKEGFKVERKFVVDTGFRATFGCDTAGPNICVISEYDALPKIGHACGHNLIAESGVAAGVGIKAALEASGNKYGKVTVMGTPAEEGGGGKKVLMKANAFEAVDVAMMVHPFRYNVPRPIALSLMELRIKFVGKSCHASAAPWDGINALDAAVICYQAISNMRQQMKPFCRVHGIFTDGGAFPNIIPEEAELTYFLRAPDETELSVIKKKVVGCAEGAAIATGCQVEMKSPSSYANIITNSHLVAIYEKFAGKFGLGFENTTLSIGSTDFGNLSYSVPGIHPMYSVSDTTNIHSQEFAATAGSPDAQAPTLTQAKLLALTAVELLQPSGEEKMRKIKQEFADTMKQVQQPTD